MTKRIKNLFNAIAVSLLSSANISQSEQTITIPEQQATTIQRYAATIHSYIQTAKNESTNKGKPLLIIIGENHIKNPATLYTNAIIQTMAAKEFKVAIRYVEADAVTKDMLINHERKEKRLNEEYLLPIAEKDLGMRVENIDNCNTYIMNKQEDTKREACMINSMQQNISSALLITGALHLKSFTESTELNQKFHILSFINAQTVGLTHEQEYLDIDRYNATSPNVIRLNAPDILNQVPMKTLFYDMLGKEPSINMETDNSTTRPPMPPLKLHSQMEQEPLEEKLRKACRNSSQDKDSGPHIYSGKGPYDTAMRTRCNFSTGILNPSAG